MNSKFFSLNQNSNFLVIFFIFICILRVYMFNYHVLNFLKSWMNVNFFITCLEVLHELKVLFHKIKKIDFSCHFFYFILRVYMFNYHVLNFLKSWMNVNFFITCLKVLHELKVLFHKIKKLIFLVIFILRFYLFNSHVLNVSNLEWMSISLLLV